jgi:hypothetical protein
MRAAIIAHIDACIFKPHLTIAVVALRDIQTISTASEHISEGLASIGMVVATEFAVLTSDMLVAMI